MDRVNPLWAIPGTPSQYSESEMSPLQLQLAPPPAAAGVLEGFTVDTQTIGISNSAATFGVPDEWVHAIKYSALSELLSANNPLYDPIRAQYCAKRYEQYLEFAKASSSILRVLVGGVPIPTDPLSKMDLGDPGWMNSFGAPWGAGVLYDWLTLIPAQLDRVCVVGVDVVRSAPLPAAGDFIQLGDEYLGDLQDYVLHTLSLKCGGKEFLSTLAGYDSFLGTAAKYGGVAKARIQYLEGMFQQPWAEQGVRPDRVDGEEV